MWRWSLCFYTRKGLIQVFSTYVEVILMSRVKESQISSFLHVCGGDPRCVFTKQRRTRFSPRMWRWSWILFSWIFCTVVFSTYVEVIERLSPTQGISWSFSPRMWRWSWNFLCQLWHKRVFSTYVEVILLQNTSAPVRASFLHVCGGDPRTINY